MKPRPADLERRLTLGLQAVLRLLLAVALLWLLVVYYRILWPAARQWSKGLAIGFGVALCIGILHFGLSGLRMLRRVRRT